MKKEIEIEIPVKTNRVKAFCHYNGNDSFYDHFETIYDFISSELIAAGICTERGDNVFPTSFREVVKNSYDAFTGSLLHEKEALLLKVVVAVKDQQVIVKFKDNGPGFPTDSTDKFFSVANVHKTPKNVYEGIWCRQDNGFFGGKGRGLSLFARDLQELHGKLELKNRKNNPGATTQLVFAKR